MLNSCILYILVSQYLAAGNSTGDGTALAEGYGVIGNIATRCRISNATQKCISGLCNLVHPTGEPCDVPTIFHSVLALVSSDVGGIGVHYLA